MQNFIMCEQFCKFFTNYLCHIPYPFKIGSLVTLFIINHENEVAAEENGEGKGIFRDGKVDQNTIMKDKNHLSIKLR